MRYIDQYERIKCRADFFDALSEAIQASHELLRIAPYEGLIKTILKQLEAIRTWTENGREPTQEERWKPQIGLILFREFETAPDPGPQVQSWMDLSKEVAGYFGSWLDDEAFKTVDEYDLPDFVEEEDPATHLRM